MKCCAARCRGSQSGSASGTPPTTSVQSGGREGHRGHRSGDLELWLWVCDKSEGYCGVYGTHTTGLLSECGLLLIPLSLLSLWEDKELGSRNATLDHREGGDPVSFGWFPGADSAGCSSISAEPAGGASKPQEGIGTGSSVQSVDASPFLLSLDLDFAPLLTAPSKESGLVS